MYFKKNVILFFTLLIFINVTTLKSQKDYSKLVNPFIGTGGHGHTYPGATSPFGMVQLSPDTRMDDWDGCSGYHYSDSIIYGFSHTHLSGTGVPDYCDILLQPTTGKNEWEKEKYASTFSHKNEKAFAGFYNVFLDKYNIDVSLTTTAHTGLHQYIYPNNANEGNVLIDLVHRDKVIDSYIEIIDDYTIKGYRFSRYWAKNQKLFFVIKFNKPFTKKAIHEEDTLAQTLSTNFAKGRSIKATFSFDVSTNKKLFAQVAISPISMDGAMLNLKSEENGFDFEKFKKINVDNWNKELSKIEIESQTYNNIDTIFYSALYHTMIVPNLYQDVDGKFRGTDDKIHQADGYTNYTVFSLWDTYRAYHPLMSIINSKRTLDWIRTFLNQYKYGGMLPMWELSANETFCMIGYHSVPVIVDAYKKGIRDFDTKLALEAMVQYSKSTRFSINSYAKNGFLSNDIESESVSKTLEYAYDDWCIAEFAKLIGNSKIADEYYLRSQNYKNLYNPATQFFQGKLHSSWVKNFKPEEINSFYTEGNAWQYRYAVQQDIEGLKKLYGNDELFSEKLKSLFTVDSKMSGIDQSDVTGLIGQYAHGNEPSHHIAYIFAAANLSKNETPFYVNKICNEFYKNAPDGLIGNEDCGQMSAWYIWSVLGMYPVNPANNEFVIGSPQIKKAIIHLDNEKEIVINVKKENAENINVEKLEINNSKINNLIINYNQFKNGATLNFFMNKQINYLTEKKNIDAAIEATNFVAAPYIANDDFKFKNQTQISIASVDKNVTIKYIIEDKIKGAKGFYQTYTKPFELTESATVYFYAEKNGNISSTCTQPFYKITDDKTINVLTKVFPMYDAGGSDALIDGIIGTTNWRAGNWQSYYGNDFEAIIDLKKEREISTVEGVFLQDTRSWIWMPKLMEVYTSDDNKNYILQTTIANTVDEKSEVVQIKNYTANFKPLKTKFIKIKAINFGIIPSWHLGVGNNAHLFISEVLVK